jgi:TonB family protein
MKDGRIVDSHIVEGTGMADIDQTALDALKASSPLDPLPKGSPASVDIKYKFDWQVKRD